MDVIKRHNVITTVITNQSNMDTLKTFFLRLILSEVTKRQQTRCKSYVVCRFSKSFRKKLYTYHITVRTSTNKRSEQIKRTYNDTMYT